MSGRIDWQIETMGLVDSTNDVAREWIMGNWIREESAHGLVIVASGQRSGRGQHGRTWESPAGGLYVSAVVEDVPADLRDKLATVAGVAAADALGDRRTLFDDSDSDELPRVGLRWPNDLILGKDGAERKVGGILCESVAMGSRWAGIIGIGMNVTTDICAFSDALRSRATSLTSFDGRLRTVTGVLDALLDHLASRLADVSRNGLSGITATARAIDTLNGKHLRLQIDKEIVEGIAVGISDQGELLLETFTHTRIVERATLLAINHIPLR